MFLRYSSSRNVFPFFQLVGTEWWLLPSRFPLFSIYLFISAFVKSSIFSNWEPQSLSGNLTFCLKHRQNLNQQQNNSYPAWQVFALCTANSDPDQQVNCLSLDWCILRLLKSNGNKKKNNLSAIFYFSKYNYTMMTYTIERCKQSLIFTSLQVEL
jgi:hypothetical protein